MAWAVGRVESEGNRRVVWGVPVPGCRCFQASAVMVAMAMAIRRGFMGIGKGSKSAFRQAQLGSREGPARGFESGIDLEGVLQRSQGFLDPAGLQVGSS